MTIVARLRFSVALAAILSALSASSALAQSPQLRVGVSTRCPATDASPEKTGEIAPLAIAIISDLAVQAAGSLIDKFSTYMTTPGVLSVQRTYSLDGFLQNTAQGVELSPSAGCVWVAVAGSFALPKDSATGIDSSTAAQYVPFSSQFREKVLQVTGVRSELLLYFEGTLQPSRDSTAWRIRPKLWYYPKFLQESGFFQKNAHDLTMTIQFAEPGRDSAPFSTFNLAWSDQAEGALTNETVTGLMPAWMSFPQVPTSHPTTGAFFPVNVTAQVIETRQPNTIAAWFGKAAADNKQAALTAISDRVEYALSQQTRMAAYTTATTNATAANDTYNTAYDKAKTAYDAWVTASKGNDPAATQRALTTAQLAYRSLSLAQSAAETQMAAAGIPFKALPDIGTLQ